MTDCKAHSGWEKVPPEENRRKEIHESEFFFLPIFQHIITLKRSNDAKMIVYTVICILYALVGKECGWILMEFLEDAKESNPELGKVN